MGIRYGNGTVLYKAGDELTFAISKPKPSCTSLVHTVGRKIVVSISEIRDT